MEAVVQEDQNIFMRLYSSINPYKDDTPTSLITKMTKGVNIQWTPTFTYVTIDPLVELVNSSTLALSVLGNLTVPVLSRPMYRFLRTDFRVVFKINSTPYHQGSLIASWKPPGVVHPIEQQAQGACGMNAVVMSASVQDEITLDIPFVCPFPHIDLLNYGYKYSTKVTLTSLNPLLATVSNLADTVPINVFVQLVNPVLYAGVPPLTGPLVEEQSSNRSYKRKNFARSEADNKDNRGMSAQGGKTSILPIIEKIPIVGPVIQTIKTVFDNLDKPRSDQFVTHTYSRPAYGLSIMSGLDQSELLSDHPQALVSKEVGLETSDMEVVTYASKPNLLFTTNFKNLGIIKQFQVHPRTLEDRTYPDYLAFAASFFEYWRGSIKYLFHFCTTAFYSCRIRITVTHLNVMPSVIGSGASFYSRIVDVKGDTWIDLDVPFLSVGVWDRTYTLDVANTPTVTIEALTPVQGASLPADAIIYLNCFRAAGPDFQLAVSRNWPVEVEEQCSLNTRFRIPFAGPVDTTTGVLETGLCMADHSTSISDMTHRHTPHGLAQNHKSYPGETSIFPGITDKWAQGFAFWRGSRRFSNVSAVNLAQLNPEEIPNPVTDLNFAYSLELNSASIMCVEIPWYSRIAYYPTVASDFPGLIALAYPQPADVRLTGTYNTPKIAGGDDFVYIYPLPALYSNTSFTPTTVSTSRSPNPSLSKTTTETVPNKLSTKTPSSVPKMKEPARF